VRAHQARTLLEEALAELASARRHLDFSSRQVAGLPGNLDGQFAALM
jgi:hypothetical protein